MPKSTKRVAAIHDLSGFGRCSLSVIIPTLSAMGIQACPIPTAAMSTHTGGFDDIVIRDLTDYISPTLAHYKKLRLEFECIYTGFLGSKEQIDHCLEFIEAYPNSLKVVDPVMGDHGEIYKTYSPELVNRMKELVEKADLITPNLTEAAILLKEEYPTEPMRTSTLKSWLVRQSKLGPKYVVITGVEVADGNLVNVGYDSNQGAFWRIDCDYVPVSYPGTGDIFASVVVGAMLDGDSLPIAMERATRFLELAIKTTFSYGTDPRFGVMLERSLPWLMERHLPKGYNKL